MNADPATAIVQDVVAQVPAALEDAMLQAFQRHHNNKTGALADSIKADALFSQQPGGWLVQWHIQAGGSAHDAYHGWFLEYGTGMFMERPDMALAGYPGKSWNTLRDQWPAGSGWNIVGRPEGPRPGVFMSHGIRPSHWFSNGLIQCSAVFNSMIAQATAAVVQLQAALQQFNTVASSI